MGELKMNTNNAFCILSAGIGKRVSELLPGYNKALLSVSGKPIISHIIEKVPLDADIIIAVGYQSKTLQSFCQSAYPERNITFVQVDDYSSPDSGPGLSILKCKQFLQRPFWFCTNDCIVEEEEYPDLSTNWMGLSEINDPKVYSTANIDSQNLVVDFKNKSATGYDYAFIGLAGIKDYEQFWHNLESSDCKKEIVSAFEDTDSMDIYGKFFNWHDTGNPESYYKTLISLGSNNVNLSKITDEITYIVNNKCVKISYNENKIEKKYIRSLYLPTPNVKYGPPPYNCISYDLVPGKTLYEFNLVDLYRDFIKWYSQFSLTHTQEIKDFQDTCYQFYYQKTNERVDSFLAKRGEHYKGPHKINYNNQVYNLLPISEYLNNKQLWSTVTNGIPSIIHGDLQFDNIIYDGNKFTFIDWRENFGNEIKYGDLYYDLAKLYGGTIFNYNLMKDNNNFYLNSTKPTIEYHWQSTSDLDQIHYEFEKIVGEYFNLDFNQIKLVTALIFLGMSPIHEGKIGDILFYHGKLILDEVLNK